MENKLGMLKQSSKQSFTSFYTTFEQTYSELMRFGGNYYSEETLLNMLEARLNPTCASGRVDCIRACGFKAVESLKKMENGSNDSLREYARTHLRRLAACANVETKSIRKTNVENEKFKLSLRQKGRCAGCKIELSEECHT